MHGQLSDPLHGAIQCCTGSPLRCGEASIPPIAFSRHCSSRHLYAQLARQKLTGSSRKSRRTITPRHRPSSKSQRACRQSLAWGKWTAKLARIYHRPINSNFLLEAIGHVPVSLDTSIKPILCPRKSGPTQGLDIRAVRLNAAPPQNENHAVSSRAAPTRRRNSTPRRGITCQFDARPMAAARSSKVLCPSVQP